MQPPFIGLLSVCDEILNRHSDVFGDLAKQWRRNISATVIWNRRLTPIGMAKLAVRSSLAYLGKTEMGQYPHHFTRFEDGNPGHID